MQNIVIDCDTPITITEEQNKVHMTNKEKFTLLVIEPNKIKDRDWSDINYLYDLVNDKFCHYLTVEPDNYIDFIGKHLNIDKYHQPYIKVEVIFEEKDYVTEIMYIEVNKQDKDKYEINEFANLLNIGEDEIYGSVIINRTFISSVSHEMYLDNITPDKLQYSLHKRANTTAILYNSDNESFVELDIFGPMDTFSEKFFDDKKYNIKKLEVSFLKHNICIWYTEDEYGTSNVCGSLIPKNINIDKMIVFSMWTEDYRESLYLDDFNKIVHLSNKLKDYTVPNEYMKEEKDSLGRNIIKNKYKILNLLYKNNI
jgi:hypothetical protein